MPFSEPIEIMNLPTWISSVFGVSGIIADALTGVLVLGILFIPLVMFNSYRGLYAIFAVLILGAFTALGWFPYWTWIIFAVYCSYILAQKYKGGF